MFLERIFKEEYKLKRMAKPRLLLIDWKVISSDFRERLEHLVGEDADLLSFPDIESIPEEVKAKGFDAIVLHANENVKEVEFLSLYKDVPKYLFITNGIESLKETHQLFLREEVADSLGNIQYFNSDYCGIIRRAIKEASTQS